MRLPHTQTRSKSGTQEIADHVFQDRYVISSNDGIHFSEPKLVNGMPERRENGIRYVYALDAYYHEKSASNYALGRISSYADDKSPLLVGKNTMRALTGKFDARSMGFSDCHIFIPEGSEDYDMLTFMEPVEEADGTVLIPAYCNTGLSKQSEVVVFRFAVDDGELRCVEHGPSIARNDLRRGLAEPRLARLGHRYYLTIRSDEIGWFAWSEDGMHFTEPTEWRWDDGEILTSRNTQQAWLMHPDGLFLVYTRETPHNRHIFRRRAPLFMARFDEDRNCLVKDTEVIVVPEMGARLGNFTVTGMKENEAWICVCEWMQTTPPDCTNSSRCVRYGANNRLWRTRIVW